MTSEKRRRPNGREGLGRLEPARRLRTLDAHARRAEQNGTKSPLTRRQEQAAILLAADELGDVEIATQCGIGRTTLNRWRRLTNFAARMAEHREAWRTAIMREGIADRVRRVRVYADLDQRLRRVITERGADPAMAGVPGGATGLLTRQLRTVKGPDGTPIWEYRVDTALLSELLAVHRQVAQELGQWGSGEAPAFERIGSQSYARRHPGAFPDPRARLR